MASRPQGTETAAVRVPTTALCFKKAREEECITTTLSRHICEKGN